MLVNWHLRSIALQIVREPENSHGIESNLGADARVRVHKPLRICHVSRRKSKNRDKQITTTDRVRQSSFMSLSFFQTLQSSYQVCCQISI